MNKTIIININGFIFHIEEDAYEILKNYMTDVKRHFLNSADSLEITTDIENRIAEMFTEMLAAQQKQVIVDVDVKQVVEQMGSVADFETPEEEAKHHNHDNYTYNSSARKLFRDPDDHLIAGVCAGLANYFSASAIWIRLVFTLIALFFGTGIILYIILWIVMPKAVTRADRMAMKGEKLNLQGFKNNFEEELNSMQGHLADLKNDAKPLAYKVRDFSGDVIQHTGSFLHTTGGLLLKLLGIFIIVGCVALIVFFTVALFSLFAFGRFIPFDDLPYTVLNHSYLKNPIYISAYLAIIIPAVALLLFTLKSIFKTRSINRTGGTFMLVIWIFSLAVLSYSIARIATNFSESANFSETISLKAAPDSVYHLKLSHVKYFSADDSVRLNINSLKPNMGVTDDPYEHNNYDRYINRKVYLSIEKSDVSYPILVKTYKAHGADYEEALSNARNVQYHFTQQDSKLNFDYTIYGKDGDLWHDEKVYLTLKLPLNSKVVIDKELDKIINGIDIWDCRHDNKLDNDNARDAVFIIKDSGPGCVIDPKVLNMRKRNQFLIDSLKNASHEPIVAFREATEQNREELKQEAERAHQRLKHRQREMIDSLEETLR